MSSGYELVCEAIGLDPNQPHHETNCPSHPDERASFGVRRGRDGIALMFCQAGCETKDVVADLGLSWADLFGNVERVPVAEYIYERKDGTPFIRVTRYQPKSFSQERWEGGEWIAGVKELPVRLPYRLPELLAADPSEPVYLCEGEKDADNMVRAYGVTATTLLGGAGKWRPEYAQFFADRHVIQVVDKDDAGRLGADLVAVQLRKVTARVDAIVAAVGKDASDHINAGLDLDAFEPEGDGLDEFGPMDWDEYEAEKTSWLLEPYVPRGGRVLAFGKTGSLKSLWAMWLAAHIAKAGGRSAYFALEMLPSTTAQRMKHLRPPKDRMLVFTKDFRIGSPQHLERLIRGLKGYDLIVVDSWTAARSGFKDSNEQVADLDNTFFLPLIKHTGASIIVIDNTGHDAITSSGKVPMDHARGASAKHDKMDVVIQFDRPYNDNNYLARITVQKMRMDYKAPAPIFIQTPTDRIEFTIVDEKGRPRRPLWPGRWVPTSDERTPIEEQAEGRLIDQFGGAENG